MKKIISVIFVYLFVIFSNIVNAFYITVEGKNVPCTIKSMEVITATRSATPKTEIASSITVVTSEDIEKKKKTNAVELLKDLPGINIAQTGSLGGASSIFIRGANPEHTLIMIDGVEMNDPMFRGRSYNLSNLTLENVEQIEIVKGPQSTLYGSDAMGGVINIITKKGQGRRFSLFSEAGSFKTFREGVEVGGGDKKFSYSLGVTRIDTEGISSAGEKYGNTEKDGYQHTSFSSRFTFMPKDKIDMDLILKYLVSKTDLDNSGGKNGDDPNYTTKNKELYLRLQCGEKIAVSFSRHNRNYNNDTDTEHPVDLLREAYSSQIRKISWQDSLSINKFNNILAGVEYEKERGKSYRYTESKKGASSVDFPQKKEQNRAYFLQDQINVNNEFFAVLGTRLDNHGRFGSKVTYRVAPGYNIDCTNTRLKASYATGFKAPSLYQLYSSYGNEKLIPEKSRGW
ncbi:MAG: TonB-dependent receptor, partial [bacterium]